MSTTALMLPDFALSLGPNVSRMSFLTSAEFALPPLSAAAVSPDEESSPPQPSSPATSSADRTPIKVFGGTAPPQVNAIGEKRRVYGAEAGSEPGRRTLRSRATRGLRAPMLISVVVPTRDRPRQLARCLAALAAQQAELEIVVVDDGGGRGGARGRPHRARRAAPGRRRRATSVRARRAGTSSASPTTTACPVPAGRSGWPRPAPAAVPPPARRSPIRPRGPAAAAAQLLTNTLMLTTRDRRRRARLRPDLQPRLPRGHAARLPFDESFALAAGEDRDWCARLIAGGGRLRHVPEAIVVHHPRLGLGELVRQQVRYGRGAVGFRAAGGALAGGGFYRRLARATVHAGPRVAGCVVLAAGVGRGRRGASARRAATRPLARRGRHRRPPRPWRRRRPARGARTGSRGACAPGATTAQASPGVWLPERPLPVPGRSTSPKLGECTPASVVAGRSLHCTTRSGSWSARAPTWCSATRSTRATAGAPSGSVNVARPAAIDASSASASDGSTIPSRSRPRRFRRM